MQEMQYIKKNHFFLNLLIGVELGGGVPLAELLRVGKFPPFLKTWPS